METSCSSRVVGGARPNGRKQDACEGGASGALLGEIVTNYRHEWRQFFPPVRSMTDAYQA